MANAATETTFAPPPFPDDLLALVIYTLATVFLIAFLLFAAWWLGAKRYSPAKDAPYESGMHPTGTARLAYPVPFYLIAIFFIVFDVEAVFIFTWAAAWDLLGIPGMIHITFFIVVLLLGLVWLWLKGGLEWGPSRAASPRGSNLPQRLGGTGKDQGHTERDIVKTI